MNEAIDERVREMVRSATCETKEAIFLDLIDELIAAHSEEPRLPLLIAARQFREEMIKIANGEGDVPPTPEEIAEVERNRENLRKQLKMNPVQFADYERRQLELDLDDVISAEELIRQLRDRAPVGTP